MASLFAEGKFQAFDADGNPLASGKLYSYAAGTLTPLATYTTQAGNVANANPVILDSAGRASVWRGAGSYRMILKSAADVTVWDVDNITDAAADASALVVADLAATDDAATGAGMVGYSDSLAYASGTVGGELLKAGVLRSGRTAPHANFTWFTDDFTVTGCAGVGKATVQEDIYDVWMSKYGLLMTGSTTWVSTTGNDGTGIGSYVQPYLTIDKAIRTTASGLVHVMPGSYDSTGFRYTDTQGDRPKMIVAPFGGVTIKVDGDALSGETFTDRSGSGQPYIYEATLGTANHVIRVLNSTQLDKLGLPTPMPYQASLTELNTVGFGWWYDSATQKIYIRDGVSNVNTNKANYTAVYATGGDNSLLVYSTKLYLENITLQKYIFVLKVSGQDVPECWMKNCTVQYAASNSRNVSGGGMYSQGCVYYRSTADHANYNTALGTTAYGVEINDLTYFAGDPDTFTIEAGAQANNPVTTGAIKNSSSNHDGHVVRINGTHDGSFGPVIADTDGSYSWNLGVSTGYSFATGASKYGWIVQGASAKAWLDGCSAGPGNSGINSDTSAVTYTFNTFGTQVTSSSGTFSAYTPS